MIKRESVTVTIPVNADRIPADGPQREELAEMVGEAVLKAAEAINDLHRLQESDLK